MTKSPKSRVGQVKASFRRDEGRRLSEELKRLVSILGVNVAIAYRPLQNPSATAAVLRKVSKVVKKPLKILVWKDEIVFYISDGSQIDESAPMRGSFRLMDALEAEAMQDLGLQERQLFIKLQNLVRGMTWRGTSYLCAREEKPERIQELLQRVAGTYGSLSLKTRIKGQRVFFKEDEE